MTLLDQHVPVVTWTEPEGIATRGTLVAIPGRGEQPAHYERFGRRVAADGYRVHAVTDPTLDAAVTTSQISDRLTGAGTPRPFVLAGSDTGALFAAGLAATGQAAWLGALVLAGLPTTETSPGRGSWDDELDTRTACPTHRGRLSGPGLRRGALYEPVPAGWAERADPGGVGVSIAAELQRAGREVVIVARGAQLEFPRVGKLRYARPDGTRSLELPAVGDPSEVDLTPDDVLVLATKTQDAEAAVADWAWRPVRHPDGTWRQAGVSIPLLTTQNGLDTERVALRRFASVLAGVLWIPATYVQAGEVISAGTPMVGVIWLGAYPGGSHPRLAGIADDVRTAGFEVLLVEDILRWKAAKLLGSVTFVLAASTRPVSGASRPRSCCGPRHGRSWWRPVTASPMSRRRAPLT